MKRPAPVAGSGSFAGHGRRRVLGLAAAAALLAAGGCSPPSGRRPDLRPSPERSVIVPLNTIAMARLILRVDQTGAPVLGGGGMGGFTPLVFPVAVAASPLDLFIADAGASRLYRYDPTLEAMAVVGNVAVTPQTRLAALPDGSVLVSDPAAGAARRYDRTGRLVQRIDAGIGAARYDDIAVDPDSGRYIALDRLQQRIEEVHPLGGSGVLRFDRQLPGAPVGIAVDRHAVYVGSRACACVVAIDPDSGQQTAVIEGLRDVGPLAAGGGWVVVADGVQRRLFIHRDGMLRGEPSFAALKLSAPHGLALVNDTLYVADGPGARVSVFRLKP